MWAISILLSSQTHLLLRFIFVLIMCVCMSASVDVSIMPVSAGAHGVPSIGFPGARVTDNVNLLMWMLGTKIGSSARTARAADF